MKAFLKAGLLGIAAGLFLAGCTQQGGGDLGTPAETETGVDASSSTVTNIQDDAIPTAPGAGSAVGGDPAGAGTAPLRQDAPPQP